MKNPPEPQKSGRKFTTKKTGVDNTGYKFIIVLICTFFSQNVSAQVVSKKPDILILNPLNSLVLRRAPGLDSSSNRLSSSPVLQRDRYVKNLAFFCRQEWKVEKATGLPLRLRIGSLEHCNRLEGK